MRNYVLNFQILDMKIKLYLGSENSQNKYTS